MFLTIKPYLHLNCVLMLNWIIWNRTVFDIKTVFTLNWIVTYNCLTSLKWKWFWPLNSVLMLNWMVLNRTDYLHKMDLALNNQQRLICHKTQQTNRPIFCQITTCNYSNGPRSYDLWSITTRNHPFPLHALAKRMSPSTILTFLPTSTVPL